jgi:hypothetical protein
MSNGDRAIDSLARASAEGRLPEVATSFAFSAVPLPLDGIAVSEASARFNGALVVLGYVPAFRLRDIGPTPERGERLYAAYKRRCGPPYPAERADLLNEAGQCLWGAVPTVTLAHLLDLTSYDTR